MPSPNRFARVGQVLVTIARAVWRTMVVLATPAVGLAGAIWIVSNFATWLGDVVTSEIAKTAGLALSGAALAMKALKATLTYVKEGWQYIQGQLPTFDPDKYAISVLITCLGIVLIANSRQESVQTSTAAVTPTPSDVSIGPVAFAPTFYFASAEIVQEDGIEVLPGIQVKPAGVKPDSKHLQNLRKFVSRIARCSKQNGTGQQLELYVLGFASDVKFFDPSAKDYRPDSDKLNLLVANLRATNTAAELNNGLNADDAARIKFIPKPWPTSDEEDEIRASLNAMRAKLDAYNVDLRFFVNSSMDHRAAIVQMEKGRVCPAQSYEPHYRMLPAAK